MAERFSLFRRGPPKEMPNLPGMRVAPPPSSGRARSRGTYSVVDAILVGVGVGLTAACATFPWYVFLNQEDFGIVALEFEGTDVESDLSGPFYTPRVKWSPRPPAAEANAAPPLDFSPTGTVSPLPDSPPAEDAETQPFPLTPARFSLVHVANGRAMIRDDNGFWVVERGSVLPDNSRVKTIENREGTWLLTTSDDRIVELAR